MTGNQADSTRFIGTKNAAPLIWKTNLLERARITETGRFGLGTSQPSVGFDVNKESRFRKDIFIDSLEPSLNSDNKIVTRRAQDGRLVALERSGLIDAIYEYQACQPRTDNLIPAPVWNNDVGTDHGEMYTGVPCPAWVGVMTANPQAALDVRGGGLFHGNLGIQAGTGAYNFSGQYALEIDGSNSGRDLVLVKNDNGQLLKLSDEGVLYSKEIRVLVPPFPDYVFAPGYKLMPLNKLSKFIADNGHLPKMPTQDVVAKEGMNVGELNVLLTEKVEELTLYTIEQEQEIDALKKEIRELKALMIQVLEEKKVKDDRGKS